LPQAPSAGQGDAVPEYVLDFSEIDQTQVAAVGGKGANLGELGRIEGIRVPPGFCVTTQAYRRAVAEAPSIEDLLAGLAGLSPDDREAIRTHTAEIRERVKAMAMPDVVAAQIFHALGRLGEAGAYAVRSSATAEDSATASFAGQHDSYLNVTGPAAILQHVSRCWASLFTERAVTYRLRSRLDQRGLVIAVVVQRMVSPRASGVVFTADPVTSDRTVTSVEAVSGLGEALVSGLVNADVYKVRDGGVIDRTVRADPVLTDAEAIRIAELGRRIEAHFGRPQDIEWCLADGDLQVVQSRPITTLFPIPETSDGGHHVYLSVGHQQMMTDAIKPLGISVWQLTALRPMFHAGSRLFVDVTMELASPARRAGLLEVAGKSDPLTGDALRNLIEREFIPSTTDDRPVRPPGGAAAAPIETDPAIVDELIARTDASIAALKRNITDKTGPALLDFILADFEELKKLLIGPPSPQAIRAGMDATWWLNDQLEAWLGEKNAADVLSQSAPNNVTSEMGLALLDVADVVRRHPEVVRFLQHVTEDADFLDDLARIPGGPEVRDAIRGYLDRYGMRCVGEIDITRPRWSERPGMLVPLILANVRNFEPGAAERHFEQGRREAKAKEDELMERLRALPDGEQKAEQTRRMIERVRTFIGYREYPKYGIVSRYFVYKQALLQEAARLVHAGVLREREEIFFLTLPELQDVVRRHEVDHELIARRKEGFRADQSLTPPRVLTSDGEAVTGAYWRDGIPAGALPGLPVSAGTVEGRARVIRDMAEADLEPGDILVTPHTDPSWSPLFVTISGLVTEVGGLMTHGAVIAREYGLPAVVGVVDAMRLIRDGQRIRVHGTEGYVELL
jgi:rifampicin phosphotransferase